MDLKNAGANWVDEEMVAEPELVTSGKPAGLPAFYREMIQMFERSASRRNQKSQAMHN